MSKFDYENVAGNHYDKYNSKNPIAAYLVSGFLRNFLELVDHTKARDAFEVGCGEGHLSLAMLRKGLKVRGADLEDTVVRQANEAAQSEGFPEHFIVRDLYELSEGDASADLVVCCEVLEHVPDPAAALQVLTGLARPWLLVSVPREPIWRGLNMARGKYLGEMGNTPGHIQHWGRNAFVDLVSRNARIEEIRTPLPWTMVLCRCD